MAFTAPYKENWVDIIAKQLADSVTPTQTPVEEPTQLIEDDMHLQQEIRKFIDKANSENTNKLTSTGVFGFIYADATHSRVKTGPCHGYVLRHAQERSDAELPPVKAVLTLINRPFLKHQSEHSVRFYDWLFNRSPFADVFMYKSAKNQFKQNWTACRTNVPGNMLQSALITSRNTWEYPDKIATWVRLVDAGINENFAYFLTHFLSNNSGSDDFGVVSVFSDHTAVGGIATVQGARHYTRNLGPNESELQELYCKGGAGHRVHALWSIGDESFEKYLKKHLKDWLAGKEKKVETNVFHRAKPIQNSGRVVVPFNQLVRFLREKESVLLGEPNA